jgi:hypothetical protein
MLLAILRTRAVPAPAPETFVMPAGARAESRNQSQNYKVSHKYDLLI